MGQGRILGQCQILGKGQFLGQGQIQGQGVILDQGQILGPGKILDQGHVQGHGRGNGQCLCVWLHLASPDVSVESAAVATTGLIR